MKTDDMQDGVPVRVKTCGSGKRERIGDLKKTGNRLCLESKQGKNRIQYFLDDLLLQINFAKRRIE